MFTVQFWRETAERALKTAAQALLVVLGGGVGLLGIDWLPALIGVAGLVASSALTSVVSVLGPVGSPNSPSLVSRAPYGDHAA